MRVEGRETRHVAGVEMRDLGGVGGVVGTEQQRASVVERRKRRRFFAVRVVAVRGEVEVGDDLRVEQAADVRCERNAVPRPDGFGYRGAAQHVAPFQNERP